MPDIRLMAHLVAGYPDYDGSLAVARALAAGGADCLQLQFPYSDPGADGPTIEQACHAALARGFRVDGGFALARAMRAQTGLEVFVMTYASLVVTRGVERFARDAKDAGVAGLMVPDLPFDYDEGLYAAGADAGLAVVPMLAPGIADARLEKIEALQPTHIHTALRVDHPRLDAATAAHLERLKATGARIIAGVGLGDAGQLRALAGHADLAAVGSYFVDALRGGGPDAIADACRVLRQKNPAA